MDKIMELLTPRHKVIADFPHTGYKINDVVDGEPFENNWGVDFKEFHAIFKKLEWWEDRQENEMPQYVKTAFGICKVIKHFVSKYSDIKTATQCVIDDGEFERALYYNTMEPATEEEFNNQNLNKCIL